MPLNLLPADELDKFWNEPRPQKQPKPAPAPFVWKKEPPAFIEGRPAWMTKEHWDSCTAQEKEDLIWVEENL